jgi:hypothetical protein
MTHPLWHIDAVSGGGVHPIGTGLPRPLLAFQPGNLLSLANRPDSAKSGRSKGREQMKKTQGKLVKESFTKSFSQRYAEMSKSEKVGYWISGFVVVTIMYLLWNSD